MSIHTGAIALDFDEGIDRKTLRRLRERFLLVNRQRHERARSALTYRQRAVLDVLPLVFHLNHPSLPGYLDGDCPAGLSHYQPSARALDSARSLARTFALRDQGRRRADIQALFLMGSSGTLGHSVASDLDVWLCHRPDLPEAGTRCLQRKARALSQWASRLGVELHVFVLSARDWRAGRPGAELSGDNCGSAQHYLLLDEFYRTGIHLGGCVPLWWLIPADQESRYDERRDLLVNNRFIRADEYIDFGPVPAIPREEFLGAGVWQLYKGIDAPWKSMLKLMLIECYARTPERPLLSLAFKQAVFDGVVQADALDPYVMLYQHLEDWLCGQQAERRLDMVRHCLYLKAGLPLTRSDSSPEHWRVRLLRQLVQSWNWPEQKLAKLDNRQRWRTEDVVDLRRAIVSELTHSYRMLSAMAREQGTAARIRAGDINLLGRKLYAAFQRKAGKVELINPGLVPSLAEENLAFCYQEAADGGSSWLLLRDLDDYADADRKPVIRRSANLAELLVWSYCNGLLTRATRLNVRAGRSSASVAELRGILDALTGFLPVPVKPAGVDALARPVRPLRCLLLVNVALDPQARLTEKGLHRLSARHDSLGYSGGRENLVLSVDLVTFNSWHEVSIQHYSAGDTLIQCLKSVLVAAAPNPGELPEIRVHCYNRGRGQAIARRVQELFEDVFARFFAGGGGPHPLRYVIGLERRYFQLEFSGHEPDFLALDGKPALLQALTQPRSHYVPVVFDRYACEEDPQLRAVCAASEPDSIQVFYQFSGRDAGIWVVDEHGSVNAWKQPENSRDYLLSPLLRFLQNLMERRILRHPEAPVALSRIRCYELVRRDGGWRAEPRALPEIRDTDPDLDVQAIGSREDGERLRFDLFCDGREFTVQEYGDRLFRVVADFIRSRRRSRSPYPVYLSDLHLPHDIDPRAYQQDLQTSQYLYYRNLLEEALNRHLTQVPSPDRG